MSFLAASKAEPFSNTLSMVGWGELFQVDGVNFHGIGVFDGVQVGGK